MTQERGPDPNQGSIDPMIPEYWELGESIQDAIRVGGYETETVEGIAVDLHDLFQAADRIKVEIAPGLLAFDPAGRDEFLKGLGELKFELNHIRWHCASAIEMLERATAQLAAGAFGDNERSAVHAHSSLPLEPKI